MWSKWLQKCRWYSLIHEKWIVGESGPDILFATTLNPKIRKLIRFNIDDMKETLETFDLLHAKNADVRQKRRELLDNSEISYMDLDK